MKPALAEALDLEPHPEGGWYRQTWVSPATVSLAGGRTRSAATLIYFLLPAGEASAWHRVASDELWLAHTGVVTLELGGSGARPAAAEHCERRAVGAGAGAGAGGGAGGGAGAGAGAVAGAAVAAQVLVPAGHWQRTLVADEDALVSCLVSPGFDFEDFELAT